MLHGSQDNDSNDKQESGFDKKGFNKALTDFGKQIAGDDKHIPADPRNTLLTIIGIHKPIVRLFNFCLASFFITLCIVFYFVKNYDAFLYAFIAFGVFSALYTWYNFSSKKFNIVAITIIFVSYWIFVFWAFVEIQYKLPEGQEIKAYITLLFAIIVPLNFLLELLRYKLKNRKKRS